MPGFLIPYIRIARPDHWAKHVFIVPGIFLAAFMAESLAFNQVFMNVALGFASACLLASANYVINEWLDSETDKSHPDKCKRASCQGLVTAHGVYVEYVLLVVAGLSIASLVNALFFLSAILFVLSGIFYNVPPFRTKDIVFVDVITESLNNPIRLLFGWSMISPNWLPPLSMMLCFLFGGAFLMAAKRLSEFRHILEKKGREAARLYRRSFVFYSDDSLLLSCFAYAVLTSFLLGVLLIKYRVEYILTMPLFTWLFVYYLWRGLQLGSVAQKPEKLLTDKSLRLITLLLVAAFTVLTAYDIPWLERLLLTRFSEVPLDRLW